MSGPERPAREAFRALRPVTTRWGDNDVYGHVNNVVHYAMFDTAVNGWLIEATGTDVRLLPAIGLVVETSCRYFAALSFPEPAEVGLALEKLGTSSVVYRLAIFGAGAQAVAVGRFVHVYVDAQTRRPVPIPDLVRSTIASLLVG